MGGLMGYLLNLLKESFGDVSIELSMFDGLCARMLSAGTAFFERLIANKS